MTEFKDLEINEEIISEVKAKLEGSQFGPYRVPRRKVPPNTSSQSQDRSPMSSTVKSPPSPQSRISLPRPQAWYSFLMKLLVFKIVYQNL